MSQLEATVEPPTELPRWFRHAQTFERAGVIERPGVNSHPTILSFFNYTTLKGTKMASSDETAWCSAFVCAMMEQVGIRGTKSAAARSWLDWGDELLTPCHGCIVVSERKDKTNAAAAHVAFWAGHVNNTQYASMGGNQNNRVCTILKPYSQVLSYRWPIGEPHVQHST